MPQRPHIYCQSCGLPLRKDPKGGGSEANGSLSKKYCSYCYEAGAFTQPEMTAIDMREFVAGKLQSMRFPWPLARFLARNVPNLERWRDKS